MSDTAGKAPSLFHQSQAGFAVAFAGVVSFMGIGLDNTLATTALMIVSPVPRNVAWASYGVVRFIGSRLAPYAAGKLVEQAERRPRSPRVNPPPARSPGCVLASGRRDGGVPALAALPGGRRRHEGRAREGDLIDRAVGYRLSPRGHSWLDPLTPDEP